MADFWRIEDADEVEEASAGAFAPMSGASRKEQITLRLDPGMILDAREIAARKGIGHHVLLRMWVMEGIARAYQEGVLQGQPRAWNGPARPSR